MVFHGTKRFTSTHISQNLEAMRVIFEPGDKSEQRNLIMNLQKCGVEFVIIDETSKKVHRKLSDSEYREAIRQVSCSLTVGSQWVAVYRILVDFYGYPSDMAAFCSKIEVLMKGVILSFPCDYQSIQKPLASCAILQKHYSKWQEYIAKKGDRVFPRQKMVADKLLELLEKA
jgi:hypothetical protein